MLGGAVGPDAALGVVLDHERAGWASSAGEAGLVAGAGGSAEAVLTVVALLGDTTDEGVRAALRRAGVEPAGGREADAVRWVRTHVPTVPRVAELLVSRVLGASRELTAACTRDLGPEQAFEVLAFATGMGPDRSVTGRDVAGELIRAAASALLDERSGTLTGLMRVTRRLPRSSGLLAVPVLDRLTHRVAELARTTGDDAERAEALSDVGIVLIAEGEADLAMGLLQEAVRLWRWLCRADEDRYRPALCAALNNLGTGYWAVGLPGAALTVQEEVIALCRRFPRGDAPWADAERARALQNAAESCTALGRVGQIEAAQRTSLDLYRRLAEGDPVLYEPLVAAVLGGFEALTESGRPEDALPANAEAVAIRRRLAAARPEHLGELAWSLNQLGTTLEALGRYEEAGVMLVEALEIQRELAREHPGRYLHHLAHSLSNLGVTLARRGRYDEAVLLEEEALGIRRGLAGENARSLKYLANLGATLLDLEQASDALAPMREAVVMRRELALDHPDKHRPDLALALSNLASALSTVGDHVAALGHAREAVELRRRLAIDLPERYQPELERSRAVLARIEAAIRNPQPG